MQLVFDQCRQSIVALAEIDGLCRHHDPDAVRRKIMPEPRRHAL
jgi:hypothetical protein